VNAKVLTVCATLVLLNACGGGDGSPSLPPPTPTYSVSGTVTGLAGTVVLQMNGGSDIAITTNGPVVLASALTSGVAFAVAVKAQPTNPTQTCTLANASGTIANANVTDVTINCMNVPLTLSSSTPANGASDVNTMADMQLVFSAALNSTPEPSSTVTLTTSGRHPTFTTTVSGNQLTVSPGATMSLRMPYTLTVSTAIRGSGGEQLAAPLALNFTTRDGLWGTPRLLESDNIGHGGVPKVAFDADGNAMAVWLQEDAVPRANVWASRFSIDTATWSAPALIETNDVGDAWDPDVALDAAGNAVAVWAQSDGTFESIWSNVFDAASGTWGTAALIEATSVGSAYEPHIAMNSSGTAIAVWYQYEGTRADIWANGYRSGAGWGTATVVETNNAGGAFEPRIAIDSSGNAWAVWSQSNTVRESMWSSRYLQGTGWEAAVLLESDDTGHAILGDIDMDSSGNAVVVWQQEDGTRYNVWASRCRAGETWGTPTLIESDPRAAGSPKIALDARGIGHAVWRQYDGARYNVWTNHLDLSGVWGTASLIENNDAGSAESPQIVADINGNALAVWRQSDGTRFDVWANRFASGEGWGTAALIETDNAGHATQVSVAIDSFGRALAVWAQSDVTRNNVVANRFD
jgi:hypothetical protein